MRTGCSDSLVNNLHKIALDASRKFHGPFLTTQLILIEIANSLSLPGNRNLAVKIIEKMKADNQTTVVPFHLKDLKEPWHSAKSVLITLGK